MSARASPLDRKQLAILAVCESAVLMVAIGRVLVVRDVDLARPAHLGWLLSTCLLGSAALALFVLRSIAAVRHAEENRSEPDLGARLGPSLALLALATLLAVAGPAFLEQAFQESPSTGRTTAPPQAHLLEFVT